MLRIEIALPILIESNIDNWWPRFTFLKTLKLLPKRPYCLNEIDDPRSVLHKMDNVSPTLKLPKILKLEPIRAYPLTDKDEPKAKQSKMLIFDPNLTEAMTDNVDAKRI
jgi:hypothetical protein